MNTIPTSEPEAGLPKQLPNFAATQIHMRNVTQNIM